MGPSRVRVQGIGVGQGSKHKDLDKFFIGDTEGNNKWLGHYPGQCQVHQPYRDCQCDFNYMSNPNPTCVYITLRDMRDAKRLKRINENLGLIQLKQMSRYDIKNALTKK